MNPEDSNELRWIRIAIEDHNKLIQEQNEILKKINGRIDAIYGAIP